MLVNYASVPLHQGSCRFQFRRSVRFPDCLGLWGSPIVFGMSFVFEGVSGRYSTSAIIRVYTYINTYIYIYLYTHIYVYICGGTTPGTGPIAPEIKFVCDVCFQ